MINITLFYGRRVIYTIIKLILYGLNLLFIYRVYCLMKKYNKIFICTFLFILFVGIFMYLYSKQLDGFFSSDEKKLNEDTTKFAVLAIFKNEEMVISEWIEHYLWQGADMIILLDNNSTDNYRDKLYKFDSDKIIVIPAKKPQAQVEHYSTIGLDALKKHNIDIVAVVDIDEYMYSKDRVQLKKSLIKIFNESDNISSVSCKWSMFGSSGHVLQPESIRGSFIHKMKDIHILQKSVYRVKDIKSMIDVHITGDMTNIDVSDKLQINHYAIQSKEYFEKVKMTRGDVHFTKNVRDWKYFNSYDYKDVIDTQLKEMVGNI
jgi:hypothetical protein